MNWLVLDDTVEELPPAAMDAEIEGLSCVMKLPKMAGGVSEGYEGEDGKRTYS